MTRRAQPDAHRAATEVPRNTGHPHFNPAVTLGAALARRVEWKALPGYWIVQVIGGLLAGLVIYLIAKGKEGFTATGNMAANGFGEHSPGGYSMWAVIAAEIVLTGMFLLVILGSTDDRAPRDLPVWPSALPSP